MLVGALSICLRWSGAEHEHYGRQPPENASLSTGPTRISATFNKQLQTGFAAMPVVGQTGSCDPPGNRRYTAQWSVWAFRRDADTDARRYRLTRRSGPGMMGWALGLRHWYTRRETAKEQLHGRPAGSTGQPTGHRTPGCTRRRPNTGAASRISCRQHIGAAAG